MAHCGPSLHSDHGSRTPMHLEQFPGPAGRASTPGPSYPSRRQQDFSGRGPSRGRRRGRSLVGLVALDAGHGGLEADLHHGCARPRVRPAASARAASICAAASPRSAGTGSLDGVRVPPPSPAPSPPRPAPHRRVVALAAPAPPFQPLGRAVTPAGRSALIEGGLRFTHTLAHSLTHSLTPFIHPSNHPWTKPLSQTFSF